MGDYLKAVRGTLQFTVSIEENKNWKNDYIQLEKDKILFYSIFSTYFFQLVHREGRASRSVGVCTSPLLKARLYSWLSAAERAGSLSCLSQQPMCTWELAWQPEYVHESWPANPNVYMEVGKGTARGLSRTVLEGNHPMMASPWLKKEHFRTSAVQ